MGFFVEVLFIGIMGYSGCPSFNVFKTETWLATPHQPKHYMFKTISCIKATNVQQNVHFSLFAVIMLDLFEFLLCELFRFGLYYYVVYIILNSMNNSNIIANFVWKNIWVRKKSLISRIFMFYPFWLETSACWVCSFFGLLYVTVNIAREVQWLSCFWLGSPVFVGI